MSDSGRRPVGRRTVQAVLVALLLLIVSLSFWNPGGGRVSMSASPNILVIVTDDQRGGISVMPDTMRWFSREGTQYTNAFVTTPTCCPSRASILTGRYVHNHGVNNDAKATVLDQRTTINYYLDEAGYHTALFGKYLNSWPIDDPPLFWDEFAYFKNSTESAYEGQDWNIDGTIADTGRYATRYIGDRAEAVIRSESNEPWFLYLAPPNPHGPFLAEPQYDKADVGPFESNPAVEETDLSDKPHFVQQSSFSSGSRIRRKQLQTLLSVDDMVQQVFSSLEATGQLNNTLAFFISDNGRLWGEHNRCCKSVPYTQAIRVPMFARWPGHLITGQPDDQLRANIDIAPTALEAARVTRVNAPLDGRSLLRVGSRTRLLMEFATSKSNAPAWASLRTPTYQYTEYETGTREYYDLQSDPWQLRNLLGDNDPSNDPQVSDLSSQLAAYSQCRGSSCP